MAGVQGLEVGCAQARGAASRLLPQMVPVHGLSPPCVMGLFLCQAEHSEVTGASFLLLSEHLIAGRLR